MGDYNAEFGWTYFLDRTQSLLPHPTPLLLSSSFIFNPSLRTLSIPSLHTQILSSFNYTLSNPNATRSPLDVAVMPQRLMECGGQDMGLHYRDLARPFDSCRGVVVSANYGGKDLIWEVPKDARPSNNISLCYIMFVDNVTVARAREKAGLGDKMSLGGWNLVEVPREQIGNARVASRIPKMLLPRIFPHARWSFWIDSKYKLRGSPAEAIDELLYGFGSFTTLFTHFARISWAEEAEETLKQHLLPISMERGQAEHYNRTGFARDVPGLMEGSVIMRDHRHLLTHVVSCVWWSEYLKFPPR